MNKSKLLFFTFLIGFITFGQSDGCTFSPALSIMADCTNPVSGTSAGATQTIPGCSGNADDDVWYEFTATSTSHQITIIPSANYDPVLQVFSNICSSLISLGCTDQYGTGVTETFTYNNYTIGQVYKLRVYHFGIGSGSGDFDICITNTATAPINDECVNAISLTVNNTCIPQTFTTDGASQSQPGCSGNADDDVWFSFQATNSVQTIIVDPLDNLDLVVQLYSGTCGNLSSLVCMDNTFSGDAETINAVGLIAGQTYFVRVYDYYSGITGDFTICIEGTPTAAPTNDEPCDAILIPEVTSACNYLSFTNVGATATEDAAIELPNNCAGGSGAAIGGFSSGSADVWFQIVVPASGSINITSEPNIGAGSLTDGVMALYQGNCSAMTQIACSDDYYGYPGSTHDLLPMIDESGLTPGDTLYLRYWGFGTAQGTFGFCVNTAINDDCANALYICDINGYSGSTSSAYTADRPCNMRGNAEQNDPPTYTYTPGTNTGGIFGQGGAWGTGAPAFDVQIDNNSWIKFTASNTTAILNVLVYDCYVGNYPSGGIQMQIFSGENCCNFVPVSNFEENSTGFTITANNLTIGEDYYLMVDGYAGDICSYTISANSGVQFPEIDPVPPICFGSSVQLSAPSGATSYFWPHSGETTQTVTVTPPTTQNYIAEVTGLCDYKQTLETTVEVLPLPILSINTGLNPEICQNQSITLTASGASTYLWSTGATTNSITVSPTTTTNYIVTGTTNGCSSSETISVQVNPLPVMSVLPTSSDSDCGLSNGALTGAVLSGASPFSFTWTNSSNVVVGNALDVNNIPAGLYTVSVTDGNGCQTSFGPFGVSNPGAPPAPTITASSLSACEGETITLTASSAEPSATFEWSGPNGFNSSNASIQIVMSTTSNAGNYCVNATANNCTSPSSCEIINLFPTPSLTLTSNSVGNTYCIGTAVELSVSGATTYSWNGPNGFVDSGNSIQFTSSSVNQTGWYIVDAEDVNGCDASDSVFVEVFSLPNADANVNGLVDNTACQDALITLQGTGGGTYSWTGPNGFTSSTQNPTINASLSNAGTYVLIVTDANNCSDLDSIEIAVAETVELNVSANDTLFCPGDALILSATGGTSYLWTGPNGFSSTDNPAIIDPVMVVNSGTYFVLGSDNYGCTDGDSVTIIVQNSFDCLFIPGLVTPNNDNLNDGWEITGIESYPNNEVTIFNRWGNVVFTISPYNNEWFGQVNSGISIGKEGGLAPSGTYFYVLELNDGETEPIKGYLELQY